MNRHSGVRAALQGLKNEIDMWQQKVDCDPLRDKESLIEEADNLLDDLWGVSLVTSQEFQASEKNLSMVETAYSDAPIGYIVIDDQGFVQSANAAANRYWGGVVRSIVGLGLNLLVRNRDMRRFQTAIDAVRKVGNTTTFEAECCKLDGGTFWGRFDISVGDRSGEGGWIFCSVADVSETKILEKSLSNTAIMWSNKVGIELMQSQVDFLVTLESVHCAFFSSYNEQKGRFMTLAFAEADQSELSSNPQGLKERINRFHENFLSPGQSYTDQVVSCPRLVVKKLGYNEGYAVAILDQHGQIRGQLVILAKTEFQYRVMIRKVLGIAGVRLSAELVRYHAEQELRAAKNRLEGEVYARTKDLQRKNEALLDEVAKRRLTEERLRKAKIKAEQAGQAKSTFLANMSHEIRTPMNGIVGVLDLLADTNPTLEQKSLLELIRKSGDLLLRLIDDILDLSKLEADRIVVEMVESELDCILNDVLALQNCRLTNSKLGLAFLVDPDFPTRMVTDPLRVRQIFENLVGNAFKFTEEGGVLIHFEQTKGGLPRIICRDTGVGMSTSQTERIFDRFVQADASTSKLYGGTGLGLAISKKLCDLLGWKIEVQSQLGVGSSFILTLPDIGRTGPSHARELMGKSIKLDIAAEPFREEICANLKLYGVEVTAEGDYDVLVTDQNEPLAREDKVLYLNSMVDASFADKPKKGGIYFSKHLVEGVKGILSPAVRRRKEIETHIEDVQEESRSLKVLVAEDHLFNQVVIEKTLLGLGHSVDITNNGEEAIRQAINKEYDFIFLDCRMPVMDGYESVRRMKEFGIGAPIYALTANVMPEDKDACKKAGFDGFVAKPVRKKSIQEALDNSGGFAF